MCEICNIIKEELTDAVREIYQDGAPSTFIDEMAEEILRQAIRKMVEESK